MSNFHADMKGVSLVELLLVLALMGIVIALGFNLFHLGSQAWARAYQKWEAESAVRFASQVITNELENASFLEIQSAAASTSTGAPSEPNIPPESLGSVTWSSELTDDDRLIGIDNNGRIVFIDTDSSTSDNSIFMENGSLEIEFSKPLQNISEDTRKPIDNVLSFTITAKDNDRILYTLESSVMLSNMLSGHGVPSGSLYSNINNSNPGNVIRYHSNVERFFPEAPSIDPSCGI